MKKTILEKTYELTDFLIKVHKLEKLKKTKLPKDWNRIGIHQSCHSLRGLKQAKSSEIPQEKSFSNLIFLLNMLEGIKILIPSREDECCGFGGLFSVDEAEVSHQMGTNKIIEHQRNKADVICSSDVSCLMHLDGIIRRRGLNLKTKHIIELIA